MIKIFSYALTVLPLISLILMGVLFVPFCYEYPLLIISLIGVTFCGLFYIAYFEHIRNDIVEFLNFITNNEDKAEDNVW